MDNSNSQQGQGYPGRNLVADTQGQNSGGVAHWQNPGQIPGQNQGHYPQFDSEPEQGGFDFYRYLRILTKFKWLIISTLATTMAIAGVLTLLMTPIFRATSSIQIDREAMNIVKIDGVQSDDNQSGQDFFQTQYELLSSRSLAERVVTNGGLIGDKQFMAQAPSLFSVMKGLILGPEVEDPLKSDAEDQDAALRNTTSRLTKSLIVAPVRGSRIVKISIDHPNPVIAQRLATLYGETFIADNLDRRFAATSYARKFLEDRLQQLKTKLEETERQAVKYAEDKGIISLGDNQNLSTKNLDELNTALAKARSERVKKELLWEQAQRTNGFGLKEILDSATLQENRKVKAKLSAEYQQKLTIYKPAFPEMMQLRNQINELDRQISTEVDAVKQSIESAYIAARQEEEDLLSRLEVSKTDVVDQRNRSIQYNILQREVDTNRQLYDGLLQRYKEIGIAGGVGTNNISVVDTAALPVFPRSPNLLLNLAIGLIAGLLLGVLAAIGLDFLDDTFKAPEDIEREIGLHVIGVVPKTAANISVDDEMSDSRSAMAEAYRSLRTGLQFATSNGLPRSLLVTSSKPAEGKTTSTISLARSLASLGLDVLLIDCDLRNASVHKRMGYANSVGLSSYLAGAKVAEDVVQATDMEKLVLITAGPLPPNPAELLSGPRFPALLTLAAESFDIVLLDGPPVMGLADAPLLSSIAQTTMLVIAANETRRSIVKVALRRLQMARANMIGAMLNKFDSKQTGYGYGYGYGEYEYHAYGTKQLSDLSE